MITPPPVGSNELKEFLSVELMEAFPANYIQHDAILSTTVSIGAAASAWQGFASFDLMYTSRENAPNANPNLTADSWRLILNLFPQALNLTPQITISRSRL
jgi:hypothetical protein